MFLAVAATLPASDMDRALAFYKATLGLEPFQQEPDGSARYQVGDTMFLLYPSEYAGTNKATAAGFQVEDLDSVVAELRSRGIEFQEFDYGEMKTVDGILAMPDGSRGAWFNDTEGNIIGLVQDA
jgi:predicted enzyme related to lactoylglutathione lyase